MEKISVDYTVCTECGKCVKICPNNALGFEDKKPVLLNEAGCTECGICEDQCPVSAITLNTRTIPDEEIVKKAGGVRFTETSDLLKDLLGMDNEPVGLKLVGPDDEIEENFNTFGSPTRHCVSIHMASLGAPLYISASNHACAAGKSSLGMGPLPEKVASGQMPYMHGLASSPESAARVMAEVPRLPEGSSIGSLVGPLDSFESEPDVIVLVVSPKLAMWVANSLIYEKGTPRLTANFAGMQASCADATTLPIKTGDVNFTVGCYGCRSAGKLEDDQMYVGIPFSKLGKVAEGLKGLRRAMGNLEDASVREKESGKGCGV